MCTCAGGGAGAAISAEFPFRLARGVTPALLSLVISRGARPDHVDPRTGELRYAGDDWNSVVPSFVLLEFPTRGFKPDRVPAKDVYARNGLAPPRAAAPRGGDGAGGFDGVGASPGVAPSELVYRREYLLAVLRREPWRRASLADDIRAAGLTEAEIEAWDWGVPGRYVDVGAGGARARRELALVGAGALELRGEDADGGAPLRATGTLNARNGVVTLDFAGEGGRKRLMGQAVSVLPTSPDQAPGILWEDGGVWEKQVGPEGAEPE